MEETDVCLYVKGSFPLIAKRKLATRSFIQSHCLKALAASLRVGFCDEWNRGLKQANMKMKPLGKSAIDRTVYSHRLFWKTLYVSDIFLTVRLMLYLLYANVDKIIHHNELYY